MLFILNSMLCCGQSLASQEIPVDSSLFRFVSSVDEIRFIKELSDVKTDQMNSDIVLDCELSKEGLRVEWFKDGKKIRSDMDYDIQVDGRTQKLVIRKANTKSIGTYRADYEKLSTSAKISIEGTTGVLPG